MGGTNEVALYRGRVDGLNDHFPARLPGSVETRTGDVMTLAIATSELHLFDLASGKALH